MATLTDFLWRPSKPPNELALVSIGPAVGDSGCLPSGECSGLSLIGERAAIGVVQTSMSVETLSPVGTTLLSSLTD
eukprot:scaffold109650_cov52-Prasinocladus_malaysianus.AAC.1